MFHSQCSGHAIVVNVECEMVLHVGKVPVLVLNKVDWLNLFQLLHVQATEYSGSNTTKTCFYELCTFIRTPLVITAEYMEINLTIIYLIKYRNVYYLSSK